MSAPPTGRIRLDKWLWHARLFRSRSLAAGFVTGGGVRVNARRVTRAAAPVGPGDTLTLALRGGVRVLRILAPGTRRGPAEEARLLYAELGPDPPPDAAAQPLQHPKGWPTPDRVD